MKRLAASFTIAARDVGMREDQAVDAARYVVRYYAEVIDRLSGYSTLDIHYHRLEVDEIFEILDERGDSVNRKRVKKLERSARRRTSEQAVRKLTEEGDDGAPADRRRPTADRAHRRRDRQPAGGAARPVRRDDAAPPRAHPAPVRVRRRGPQGRRRRQRRARGLRRADVVLRRWDAAHAAGQAGGAVGPVARRRGRVPAPVPGPARRRRPEADAGGERPIPRLAEPAGRRLLRPPAARHEGLARAGEGLVVVSRLRAAVRSRARVRARAIGRAGADRRLPGPRRRRVPGCRLTVRGRCTPIALRPTSNCCARRRGTASSRLW